MIKKIIIKEKDKLNKLDTEIHTESEIYFYNDDLLKIYLNTSNLKNYLENIKRLYNLQLKHSVNPKYIVLNTNKAFIGFGMNYLNDYNTLYNYLENNDLNYEEKKSLILNITNILRYFENNNIAYGDVHPFNILINNNDIKFIDMDSVTFKNDDKLLYRENICLSNYKLIRLFLSLFYEINTFSKYQYYNMYNKLKKYCSSKQLELLKYSLENTNRTIYLENYIELFNEDFINSTRKIILKK